MYVIHKVDEVHPSALQSSSRKGEPLVYSNSPFISNCCQQCKRKVALGYTGTGSYLKPRHLEKSTPVLSLDIVVCCRGWFRAHEDGGDRRWGILAVSAIFRHKRSQRFFNLHLVALFKVAPAPTSDRDSGKCPRVEGVQLVYLRFDGL
jgi:hypothetical protein